MQLLLWLWSYNKPTHAASGDGTILVLFKLILFSSKKKKQYLCAYGHVSFFCGGLWTCLPRCQQQQSFSSKKVSVASDQILTRARLIKGIPQDFWRI